MYKHFIKPVADRILALCLLLLFAPVMLLTALMVRIKLGKPLLFSQERPGLHGNVFRVYKFRSMSDARDATGELLPDDIRLGHFGKLLRSTSLDELPQLWNVLKGDMSFIGPRPLLVEYLPLYNAFQRRRHEVRPGITGWAQVNGRNAITWDERFALDVWYVDHVSLWTDIRIVVMTIYKIFRRDGVSQGGHVTMPRFMGNENKGASNDTIA